MKKSLLLCYICLMSIGQIFAQDRTVRGKITDATDGTPIPGVSVTVKGTTKGTSTDALGMYQLAIPAGAQSLVFSFIGFTTTEEAIGSRSTIDVALKSDVSSLEEVVITGLNIQRDQKTVTYAVQQVNADKQLRLSRDTDLNSTLAGKIAGVQVLGQAGSKLGSSANIRIRGGNSLIDKNPLYVVDGTPINNLETGARGTSPVDLGINMDDVENISVLKGPNATALYGQRGDAGVILITTKKGKKKAGIGIDLNHTTTFEKIAVLPKYQNLYGGGGESEWRTFTWAPGNPEEWKVFDGKKYHDYSDDASWGPKLDGTEYIPWHAWYPGHAYSFKTATFDPQPNNVRDFYDTGKTFNTNVNLSKAGDGYNVRVSYTNTKRTGIIPNSSQERHYLSAHTTFDLGKHFTAGANINYTNDKIVGDFGDGYSNFTGSGSFNQWFHRNLDINVVKELQDYITPTGTYPSWNHGNPTATTNLTNANFNKANYHYNWYTYTKRISNVGKRDRLFGDINLMYKLNDHFNVQGFIRRSQTIGTYENKTPTILELSGRQTGLRAGYATGQSIVVENNYEFLATYQNTFGAFDINANVGGNIRHNSNRDVLLATNGGLVVPDLFTISNSKTTSLFFNYRQDKEVRSLYGRASVGYKDFLFLELTGRNDWSSALPKNNNSYFYPSIGTSIVFSELTQSALPFLSYGKVRASWAQVGSDIDPYQLALYYGVNQSQYNNANILMTTPNTIPATNIVPSLSSAYELGTDLKFLKDRLGLSFTYYKENKINEILPVAITGASGFTQKIINAGRVERNGIEIQLNATPIATQAFNWDITFNVARNNSKIIELAEGVNETTVATPGFSGTSTFSFASLVHKTNYDGKGNQWGQLKGVGIKRIDGQPVLGEDGMYQYESNVYFGSVLPDFTGGIFNTLSYKNLSLAFSADFQKGGKYFSLSNFWGQYSGLYEETAAINDKGKNVRDDVADGGGVHVFGVNEQGQPVDYYVGAQDYYHQFGNNNIADNSIFDASFVTLREVSLGYTLPIKNKKIFQNISFSVVSRNVWFIYLANRNIDASSLSQRFGENAQQPSTRSMGFTVKLGF